MSKRSKRSLRRRRTRKRRTTKKMKMKGGGKNVKITFIPQAHYIDDFASRNNETEWIKRLKKDITNCQLKIAQWILHYKSVENIVVFDESTMDDNKLYDKEDLFSKFSKSIPNFSYYNVSSAEFLKKYEPTWKYPLNDDQIKKLKEQYMIPKFENPAFVDFVKNVEDPYLGYKVEANRIFPNGIPPANPFIKEPLNKEQAEFLFRNGGANTLFFLGNIDQIRKVIDKDLFNLYAKISKEDTFVFKKREDSLRSEVLKYIENNDVKNLNILIVYGSGHDIVKLFPEYNVEKIVVGCSINFNNVRNF